MTRHRIAGIDDLPEGEMAKYDVGGRTICLANVKGVGFRAIDDRCTHEDESLSEGFLCGEDVECPAHGSRFSFLTGEVSGLPATMPVRVYEVSVDDGSVYVDLTVDAPSSAA